MSKDEKKPEEKEAVDYIKSEQFDYNINPYQAVTTEVDEHNEQHVVLTNINKPRRKQVPEYTSQLRGRIVEVPKEIYEASGIMIFGSRIKSLLFTTDVAVIRNSNAQSVMAVYPFTPQGTITQAVINSSSVPVFAGVGGGTTTGQRSVQLAFQAEIMGAYGVVVNSPMKSEVIKEINKTIDIPLIATISSFHDDFMAKLKAGADILNISGGAETVALVKHIRETVGPDVPIIATGGPSGEDITATIKAGANAITYTPPTSAEIFAEVMKKYRHELEEPSEAEPEF